MRSSRPCVCNHWTFLMSIQVFQGLYTEEDYSKYQERISEQPAVLADLIRMSDFGGDNYRFGGEIGYYLTNKQGLVQPINKEVLIHTGDIGVNLALNKYQLALQLSPFDTSGRAFQLLQEDQITAGNSR